MTLSPQSLRVLAYLEDHPEGVTTWDVTMATRCLNLTARVSEIRAELEPSGRSVECSRFGSIYRYRLVLLHPVQGELFEMAS